MVYNKQQAVLAKPVLSVFVMQDGRHRGLLWRRSI